VKPPAAFIPEEPPPVDAPARPIDELTRRCSSGVSWKIYSTRSLVWSLSYPLKDAGVAPEKVQAIIFALEKAGRHGGAGADGLRIDDPALDPIGLEAPLGLQEVGAQWRFCRARDRQWRGISNTERLGC